MRPKPEWTCRRAGLGHCFRPPISFFPSSVKENIFWGSRHDSPKLLVQPPVSLLVSSQDAECHLAWCNVSYCTCQKSWSRMTDPHKQREPLDKGWSRGGRAGKQKISKQQDIRRRTGSQNVKKEHWVEKRIPKRVLLILVESPFFDPDALSPQCLLPAVCWHQQTLGTTLRTWPTTASQGPLLSYCLYSLLLWPITSVLVVWGDADLKT